MSHDKEEDADWLLAPIICAAILTLGVIAGVVSALRQGGRVEYAGIPLPQCKWLTSRCSVRVAAFGSLLAGLAGQLSAFGHFLKGWHDDDVPFYLMSCTLVCYSLLASALVLASIGLQQKQTAPKAHEAFRQSAKAAFLGGLAAGLAAEVLCNAGESRRVPYNWRVGCGMLGASCGMLLLGLLAAQFDGQAGASAEATDDISTNGACAAEDVEKRITVSSGGSDDCSAARTDGIGAESDSSSLWTGCHPWPSWTVQERDLDWAHPRQPQAQHLPHIPRPMAPAMGSSFQQPLLLQQPSDSRTAQRSWPSGPRRDMQWPLWRNTSDAGSPWAGCGVGSQDAGLRSVPTLMVY